MQRGERPCALPAHLPAFLHHHHFVTDLKTFITEVRILLIAGACGPQQLMTIGLPHVCGDINTLLSCYSLLFSLS